MWVRKQEVVNGVIASYEQDNANKRHQITCKKKKKKIKSWDIEIGAE